MMRNDENTMRMKKRKVVCRSCLLSLEPVLRLVLLEAVPAVDRPALSRLEWNLGLSSTVGANYIVHFAGPVISGAVVSARPLSSVHYYYLLLLAKIS